MEHRKFKGENQSQIFVKSNLKKCSVEWNIENLKEKIKVRFLQNL